MSPNPVAVTAFAIASPSARTGKYCIVIYDLADEPVHKFSFNSMDDITYIDLDSVAYTYDDNANLVVKKYSANRKMLLVATTLYCVIFNTETGKMFDRETGQFVASGISWRYTISNTADADDDAAAGAGASNDNVADDAVDVDDAVVGDGASDAVVDDDAPVGDDADGDAVEEVTATVSTKVDYDVDEAVMRRILSIIIMFVIIVRAYFGF